MPTMGDIVKAMNIISKTDKAVMEGSPELALDRIWLPGKAEGMDCRDMKKLDQMGIHWDDSIESFYCHCFG
jgi:hypothetical protein